MTPFAKETLPISLEEEMRRSYLDYAMSVIVGRALPDARDGLKPVQAGVNDFVEVVRRDVGGHAHRDARRAVDQQVGPPRRHHRRLFFGAVVVGREVDRLLVDIGQHLVGDLGQPDFGVAHRRRAVAVDRTEVALAVDQHVAQ